MGIFFRNIKFQSLYLCERDVRWPPYFYTENVIYTFLQIRCTHCVQKLSPSFKVNVHIFSETFSTLLFTAYCSSIPISNKAHVTTKCDDIIVLHSVLYDDCHSCAVL